MPRRSIPLSLVLLFPGVCLIAQSASGQADFTFSVPSTQVWTDTGLDLQGGDLLQISVRVEGASASTREADSGAGQCDPRGAAAGATSGTVLPLASAPAGALIAKLHESSTAIMIGGGSELHIQEPSHLFLGVNIADAPVCQGSFLVKVRKIREAGAASGSQPDSNSALTQAQPPGAATSADKTGAQPKPRGEQLKSQLTTAAQIFMAGQFGTAKSDANSTATANASSSAAGSAGSSTTAPLKVSDSPLDSDLRKEIESLPRRVNDQFKNLGDMVNFVIVGAEKDVQTALEAANWHVADTNNERAVLSAVMETYEKKDYLQMPMSTLYLFGRPQDFGYEQAEPIAMVASRHHFRIWKAPFTWMEKEVWVGAGTHDIGFAKDQRNGSATHKIDPAVDGERDNIGSSLEKTGKIKSLNYYLPTNPVQEAKNATGDGYHSDGRLLVIFLQ